MIPILTAAEVAGTLTWEAVVSSWHGSRLLASDIPVAGGSVAWSTRRDVPGSVDLEVPRTSTVDGRRYDWLPRSADHPLSYHGQVLAVSLRVGTLVSRRVETIPYGRFMVTDFEDTGATVRISGVSLAQRIVEQRFASPTPTRSSGTFASELRRIVPASLGVRTAGMVDRPVPAMSWDEDRMAAVREVADAWPALVREDMSGTIVFRPPLGDAVEPVLHLTDLGVAGTVASAYRSGKRDGIYTSVVARGQETDEAGLPTLQGEATQYGGDYGVETFGLVRRFFSSPLITSLGAAHASARTILASSILPATTLPVACTPDPRIELDDLVAVTSDGHTSWGWVSGLQMPLTPEPTMRVDIEQVWED